MAYLPEGAECGCWWVHLQVRGDAWSTSRGGPLATPGVGVQVGGWVDMLICRIPCSSATCSMQGAGAVGQNTVGFTGNCKRMRLAAREWLCWKRRKVAKRS